MAANDKFYEKKCPVCNEMITGIFWKGGNVIVFDHKGVFENIRHSYKLVMELVVGVH